MKLVGKGGIQRSVIFLSGQFLWHIHMQTRCLSKRRVSNQVFVHAEKGMGFHPLQKHLAL